MSISFWIREVYCIQVFSTIFLCLVQVSYSNGDIRVDSNYVGVVFSPYSKNGEGSTFPARDSYTMKEVESELQIVSSKFRNISTYGAGATSASSTWQTGDGVGFTGIEAAKLNKKLRNLAISVAIGVWQHNTEQLLSNEIKTAFDITEEANKMYAGTVWGITLTSNYIQGPDQAGHVGVLIDQARKISAARNISVSLGVRITICEKMLETLGNKEYLRQLLRKLDYVICFKNPPSEPASNGVLYTVKNVANIMMDTRNKIHNSVNPKLLVIFETGWPSDGISSHNLPTSTKLMNEYWTEISIWASKTAVPIYLFAAFDEPWKSGQTEDRKAANGPCGAEGHYGWWRRLRNDDTSINSYVEKIKEPELHLCKPAEEGLSPGSIAGIAFGVLSLTLAFFAVLILLIKLKMAKTEKLSEDEIAEFEQGVTLTDEEAENYEVALRLPYDRKFELEKDKFYIDKHAVLGSGAFGIVYKGKIEGNESDVAFKTTKPACPVENLKGLLSEIKLMIYIGKHENIVGLVAAYTGQLRDGEVYIASEYCAKGSLEKFLRSSNSTYVNVKLEIDFEENEQTTDQRYINTPRIIVRNVDKESLDSKLTLCLPNFVRWSYEIAIGMSYLASKNVIHADLATRNVLLTENGIAKITDFGLSRKLYAYTNYVKKKEEPLPWRWMSIESLKKLSFSTQSDVWSYGITLWEIFSLGDIPYPGLGWDLEFVEKLVGGLRLKQPKDATPEIYTQMKKCWHADPEKRPTFTELADYFFQLKTQMDVNYYLVLEE